jgi:predicted transposase/invertase (TIGR01784 family)
MKTDTLFYRLFQRWPALALELLGLKYDGASYRFGSEEIKQTAFRIDGLFTPITDDPRQPVIFAEVQYQPDVDFYDRLFSEITLYLRLHKPGRSWLALVIYPNRHTEKPASLEFEPFLNLPQLHRIYLEDYQNKPGLTPTLELIRLIASHKQQTISLAQELAGRRHEIGIDSLDFIETILVYKLPHLSREEIKKMLALNDIELKQTRFYQEIAEEEKKKGLFEGHQQGLSEGLQEGLQEGQKNEAMNLLARLVRRKFKGSDELSAIERKLQELSVDQLEEMAEALLDFKETQELNNWLLRQSKP